MNPRSEDASEAIYRELRDELFNYLREYDEHREACRRHKNIIWLDSWRRRRRHRRRRPR